MFLNTDQKRFTETPKKKTILFLPSRAIKTRSSGLGGGDKGNRSRDFFRVACGRRSAAGRVADRSWRRRPVGPAGNG